MKSTTQLRKLLAEDRLILAPFVYDAFTAKMAESAGYGLLYLSGFGTSMSLGFADVGLVTQTEMAQTARNVARTVSVPVIADADTGYGNPLNVWRTVREYEAAGMAGLHIEDQVFPKKCGYFQGKDVIPLEEHVQKVRAALDARTDPDFLIIARTDALAIEGWQGVIRRCRAYREAGADMVFVDGVDDLEAIDTYAAELPDLPRLLNVDFAPVMEVEKRGFKVMIHRGPMFSMYLAGRGAMRELRETGSMGPSWHEVSRQTRQEIAGMLGLDGIYEMEERYRVSNVARS